MPTKSTISSELRGLVSVGPGGTARSAEIHIVGYGGRSFMYEFTLPEGRYVKRVGMHSLAEAKVESEKLARLLLAALVADPDDTTTKT